MHIGIDLQLQKLNSNVISSLRSEEKDWLLNEEVIRFIKQRINPASNDKRVGFEATQKRYDDLRVLITPASLPVYVNDNDSVFTYLPSDYFTLINDRSVTKDLCGVSYSTIATSIDTFYIASLPIADDNTNLYATFQVKINGSIIFDLSNYVTGGLPSSNSKFVIVNYLLQRIAEIPTLLGGFSGKYENYFGVSVAGAVIIVGKSPFTYNIVYVGNTVSGNGLGVNYTKVTTPLKSTEVPNRLAKTEDVYTLLSTSFGTTFAHTPITLLEGSKLIAFHKQKFILSSLNISYIRKPKKIDISLNQGCELSESIHQEIVENTAKRIAGLVGSQQYNNIINENLLKE